MASKVMIFPYHSNIANQKNFFVFLPKNLFRTFAKKLIKQYHRENYQKKFFAYIKMFIIFALLFLKKISCFFTI